MYQLRQPCSQLSRFIEHYWFVNSTEVEPISLSVNVFVDGRADLILNFGAPYGRAEIGGEVFQIAHSNLDLQRLKPIRITQEGALQTTGVRFRLGGLGPFVHQPLTRLTDSIIAPEQAFGRSAIDVELAIKNADSADEQAHILDEYFCGQLDLEPDFETFAHALQTCEASQGNVSVEDMANQTGVSSRQLARLFARWLGFPPKTLCRIVRFQMALKTLMQDPKCSLAEVAKRTGYFDQAHFIKDFQKMSGGVPRGYRGYFPKSGPNDFAPNVVAFLQDGQSAPV